jgi:hypothetical protein
MYRKMENKNYETAEEAISDLKNGYFLFWNESNDLFSSTHYVLMIIL